MKKKWLIIGLIALVLVITAIVIFLIFKNQSKIFSLESKYYNTGEKIEITASDLENLIEDKESFVVFVSQDMCMTSSNFAVVINEFLEEYPITIYEINYSELKENNLGDFLEYYPSFVIYKDGKVVDFLDANADEDTDYYKSASKLASWLTNYISLDETNKNNRVSSDGNKQNDVIKENEEENADNNVSLEAVNNLDYIAREDGKVNIYFFWGDGCHVCENTFAFFDEIEDEYSKYYNLYTFETWYNEENEELLYTFAQAVDKEVRGVPFIIIGEEVFPGFNEESKEKIIDAILNQYNDSYDVYFDIIKNQM